MQIMRTNPIHQCKQSGYTDDGFLGKAFIYAIDYENEKNRINELRHKKLLSRRVHLLRFGQHR